MTRVARSSLPDGYFHVYARGIDGLTIFPTDVDKSTLFDSLPHCENRYDLRCLAACVLSTHYHVVVEATREALSRGFHWLNLRYAHSFNRRYGRFGHVFAERFSTRALEGGDRVSATCEYVLLNPVKAGLCERADDWPWSYSRYGSQRAESPSG
jgi:putative transposase